MLSMAALYYFSPTGGTRKVIEIFSSALSEKATMVDLGARVEPQTDVTGDIAVLAAPVFGGRIPGIVADKIRRLKGAGKKAVTIVVYGNRAFEDALLELNDAATSAGFQIVASGAFIAQHSMAPEVGRGRPDKQDEADIRSFAQQVLDKIEDHPDRPVAVPGNQPYKSGMSMSATPISSYNKFQVNRFQISTGYEMPVIE